MKQALLNRVDDIDKEIGILLEQRDRLELLANRTDLTDYVKSLIKRHGNERDVTMKILNHTDRTLTNNFHYEKKWDDMRTAVTFIRRN